jgi:hypothetical protein
MNVVEFLKSKNVPETLIAGQDAEVLKGIAKAMGFQASAFEVVTYTRKEGKNAGKPAQYLKSNIKGPDGKALRSQVFEFLCEGDTLTAEGEARRVGILVALGNSAADAIG